MGGVRTDRVRVFRAGCFSCFNQRSHPRPEIPTRGQLAYGESWKHGGIRLISPPPIMIFCPTKKYQQARSKFGPNGTSTSNTRPWMGQRQKTAQPSEISIPVSQGGRPTKRYPLGFVGSPIIHHKSLSHSSKSAYDGIRPTS